MWKGSILYSATEMDILRFAFFDISRIKLKINNGNVYSSQIWIEPKHRESSRRWHWVNLVNVINGTFPVIT